MSETLNSLINEMAAQIALRHKRFCVGWHDHGPAGVEEEWCDWTSALQRLADTAKAERAPIDAVGNTELQPGMIADMEVGRFLVVQEKDGTRWAICDFLSRRKPTTNELPTSPELVVTEIEVRHADNGLHLRNESVRRVLEDFLRGRLTPTGLPTKSEENR